MWTNASQWHDNLKVTFKVKQRKYTKTQQNVKKEIYSVINFWIIKKLIVLPYSPQTLMNKYKTLHLLNQEGKV